MTEKQQTALYLKWN